MRAFDIAPFALPNHPPGELCFEEPRDVRCILVRFNVDAPPRVGLSYLCGRWPAERVENLYYAERHRPAEFGWAGVDDLFNARWRRAAVICERLDRRTVALTFRGLRREFPDVGASYDVRFRRTMGVRVEAPPSARVGRLQVCTASPPARTRLRVELDAGRRTPGRALRLSGYNARVGRVQAGPGTSARGATVGLGKGGGRSFEFSARHAAPAHRYCYDEGLVTFALDGGAFTISLPALEAQGPIWHAARGVYVARADDPTRFADYRRRIAGARTVSRRVADLPEQTLGGAMHGQPRPHPDAFVLGCKGVREQFWIEPNGDVVLSRFPLCAWPGERAARFRNRGDGRFMFGLERWQVAGRTHDAPPMPASSIRLRRGALALEQRAIAVPLDPGSLDGELEGDAPLAALVRFRFTNLGDEPADCELPVGYSAQSGRSRNSPRPPERRGAGQDDELVPLGPREPLEARAGLLTSPWEGRSVVRAAWEGDLRPQRRGTDVVFRGRLAPGRSCELVLKIPYVSPEARGESAALKALRFDECSRRLRRYWRRTAGVGARVRTPEPRLDDAYALHLPVVMISDPLMPGGELINTSVGTATYGNFCNESCMIQQELDQRGLHQEARRRLMVYVRHQGSVLPAGNFTDCRGVYFGTGGFDGGRCYVQNHGWVMWRLAEHYFMTNDAPWLMGVAGSLIEAADWVFRQRRNTMGRLPHSRGWERGFMPAGGLEDVGDFHYWQNNNVIMWWGTEWTARALEAVGHPQAGRIRRESDAYRRDLERGFEIARAHSPLVRLRDGRWVPHYPTRLYRRGRDFGWIRETLEGSVYLLLTGFHDPRSEQGGWILDDFQDNRYMNPPYGYIVEDPERNWYARGGFSIQPNLLAGLLPHLDRDEPEVYLWMFFNAWAACYREETGGLVEHPMPVLGFSNAVPFKTSDQSNAMKWLVYMFVYAAGDVLHLGRAVPRYWLKDGCEPAAEGVATVFGRCSVAYRSEADAGRITARADLSLHRRPGRILLRFRHPEGLPVRSVRVNGRPHAAFDPARGDVDLTGRTGRLTVVARMG